MGQQRRRYDAQYKADIVLDILINGKSYGEASREYGIKDSVLSRWRQEFVEQAAVVFGTRSGADPREARIGVGADGWALGHRVGHGKKSAGLLGLSKPQKRAIVKHLVQAGHSVVKACAVLDLPRSSYYYMAAGESVELREQVRTVAQAHPLYGSRRITAVLRREPYKLAINRKAVQRVMKAEGLLQRRRRHVPRTTQSEHGLRRYPNLTKGREVTHANEVWVADITYIRLGQVFIYLAIVLDVYTRVVRGWCLSRHLDEALGLEALRMALAGATPEIHHSDQGVQYAASSYGALLESRGVHVSMSARHSPHQNGYAERFMRTLQEEEVHLSDYRTFAEARQEIGQFIIEVYNRKRIHSSLGYLPPVEFEEAHRQVQAPLIGL